ncbi:hypothetical protein [Klebsiella pneumoniae]|uniref:hypothetical protein n=1 Tax=Klebsiella pneumoniae TaxID=573 RepID=UPI0022B6A2E1|nr:hypothetical protein [Klebsiella pneumoniae]
MNTDKGGWNEFSVPNTELLTGRRSQPYYDRQTVHYAWQTVVNRRRPTIQRTGEPARVGDAIFVT